MSLDIVKLCMAKDTVAHSTCSRYIDHNESYRYNALEWGNQLCIQLVVGALTIWNPIAHMVSNGESCE